MRLIQRNLMGRSTLLLSLLFSVISPVVVGQNVSIVVSIRNNACQSGTSNNGNTDLGVVGVGDFTGSISAENYHSGGKKFTTTIQDRTFQGTGDVLDQLHINSRAFSGVMVTDSSQIFANEGNAGTKDVGVVVLPTQDSTDAFNVLSVTGSSRSVYLVMSLALNNLSWKFST